MPILEGRVGTSPLRADVEHAESICPHRCETRGELGRNASSAEFRGHHTQLQAQRIRMARAAGWSCRGRPARWPELLTSGVQNRGPQFGSQVHALSFQRVEHVPDQLRAREQSLGLRAQDQARGTYQ